MTLNTLRIAQITDIHLTENDGDKLQGVDTGESLRRVLGAIGALSPRPSLIIASGDLVQTSNSKSYGRLKSIFCDMDLPVYVLPGNHDEAEMIRQHLAGGSVKYQSKVERHGWSILFVDSTIKQEHHGMVSEKEQTLLEGNIGSGLNQPILVALHHPTINSCPSFSCRLDNNDKFIAYLKGQPSIKAVIAGHTHLAAKDIDADLAQYTTPSTFAQITHSESADPTGTEDFWISHAMDSSVHGYRILDLYADGQVDSFIGWVASSNN
ncbi:MAG: Icc protein [Polaribacter sp.]|jgi:Icc protein